MKDIKHDETIVVIQHNRLKKYNYCSYGAYLQNWSKYNWKLVNQNKDELKQQMKIKYRIEYIEWIDSFGCSSGWSEIKPIETVLICVSVGFVVSENDKTISLANSVAYETEDTKEQANGIMTIPKVSIISRKELKQQIWKEHTKG